MKPHIEWVFSVRSSFGRRTYAVLTAPIDADVHELRQQLLDVGYDCIYLHSKIWNPYAWPGGYPLFLVMKDGGCVCIKCTKEDREVRQATMDPDQSDPWWAVDSVEINYEDPDLTCDHCSRLIESAYGGE